MGFVIPVKTRPVPGRGIHPLSPPPHTVLKMRGTSPRATAEQSECGVQPIILYVCSRKNNRPFAARVGTAVQRAVRRHGHKLAQRKP